jgi:hypothetical protein
MRVERETLDCPARAVLQSWCVQPFFTSLSFNEVTPGSSAPCALTLVGLRPRRELQRPSTDFSLSAPEFRASLASELLSGALRVVVIVAGEVEGA